MFRPPKPEMVAGVLTSIAPYWPGMLAAVFSVGIDLTPSPCEHKALLKMQRNKVFM